MKSDEKNTFINFTLHLCNNLFPQEVIRLLNDEILTIYREKPCSNDSISIELKVEFYNTRKCDVFNLINNNNTCFTPLVIRKYHKTRDKIY